MAKKLVLAVYIFCLINGIIYSQNNVIANPFIGRWIMEADPSFHHVYTANRVTAFFDGVILWSANYVFDGERITIKRYHDTRFGRMANHQVLRYTFSENNRVLYLQGFGIFNLDQAAEERRQAEQAAAEERRLAQQAAEEERRRAEEERRLAQQAAAEERRQAEEERWLARQAEEERRRQSCLFGYVFTPNMPVGLLFGSMGYRFGAYFSFNFGSGSDLPSINNPENIPPIESREDIFMAAFFGMYVRIIGNLHFDLGLGFFGSDRYGLFYVVGHDEPVWRNLGRGGEDIGIGFAMQAGLLYSFRWLYLNAGFRQYFNNSFTPSFYIGIGLRWRIWD